MKSIFQTERMFVRPLRKTDIDNFKLLLDHPKVKRYTDGTEIRLEEGEKDFEKLLTLSRAKNKDFWVWAVVRKDDRKFLGTCAVIKTGEEEHEIGYRLFDEFWGRGYGHEIAEALVDFCHTEMNLENIKAYVDSTNRASVRILGKTRLNFLKEVYNKQSQSIDYVFSS